MYASIDAEVYVGVLHYLGPDFVIQDCVETYLDDLSYWLVKQGREVFIVVGHGIRTNPLILKVVYSNLKSVIFHNIAKIFSPLELGAVFEFHACYRILVMHNLLGQNAPMHTAFSIDKIVALLYLLHPGRTVTPTAIFSGFVSSITSDDKLTAS